MADLAAWGLGATPTPPLVKRERICQSPHTGKIAGFIGRDIERGFRVYTALRKPQHYFRNADGYAISDSILALLDEWDVSRILIHEGDEESDADVYEFTARQYHNGHEVPEDDLWDTDDPQTYVPRDEHFNLFESHAGDLFYQPFKPACDRIMWRGYNPDHPAREESRR